MKTWNGVNKLSKTGPTRSKTRGKSPQVLNEDGHFFQHSSNISDCLEKKKKNTVKSYNITRTSHSPIPSMSRFVLTIAPTLTS